MGSPARARIEPDDLVATADLCRTALESHLDAGWDVRAANVKWTCRQTLEHVCGLKYAVTLATRSTERRQHALAATSGASIESLLATAHGQAVVLSEVAKAAGPGVRAYHSAGMADAEGFLAMGIDELLVHTHDIAGGLGSTYEPPAALLVRLLDRLFPWWPGDEDPWQSLLWANGRAVLPDRPNPGASWLWHCRPLSEWSGEVPRWDPVESRPATN